MSSFSFAADVIFSSSNINDANAWNTLNNSAGSIGTITSNLVLTSAKNITRNNITLQSDTGGWRNLVSSGTHRLFSVAGNGTTFNLNNIVLVGGIYDGLNTEGGGAISVTGNGLNLNGTFAIERSSSSSLGGAIYVRSGTTAINGNASFIMNYAADAYGGAIYSGGDVVLGAGSHLNLQGNYAGLSGGGIYSLSGSVNIGGTADISTNTAKMVSGGGIYAANNVRFSDTNAEILISSNAALDKGGGVYAGGYIIFDGGANIKENSVIMESSSDTYHKGGGLYAESYVSFTSTAATIKLNNNKAKNAGGGIFSNSTVTFSGSAEITSNNVETSSGGAVWAAGNIVFDNADASATISSNNTYEGSGGAFYSDNNISFAGYLSAADNAATYGSGGAFYSRTLTIGDGAKVTGNNAGEAGGAVFIHDGTSNFNALTRDILFENNVASKTANDVNLGGNAILNLTAADGDITFNSGISYSKGTTGNIVNKYGYGTLYLKGIFDFQTLNISSGSTIIGSGTSFEAVNFSLVGSNPVISSGTTTVLDMRNNSLDDNLIVSGVLRSTTGARIYYDIDSNTNASDTISAAEAYMNGTIIKVGIAGVDAAEKAYKIISSTNGYGAMYIDNTNAEGNTMNRVKSHLLYHDGVFTSTIAPTSWKSVDLVLSIDQLNVISGLTENQKKVAYALDKEYGMALGDLFYIIDEIDSLPDTSSQKKALTSLSGHVYANAITVAALNASKDSVLSRLKKSYFIPDDSLIKRNIWAQGYTANNKYKGDKNSPGDFSASNAGVQAGFDTMRDDTQIFGLSIGYVDTSAEQNSDTVDINGYNIGGYGAFFFENNLELKLMLIGGRQNYSAARKIKYGSIDRKTDAEFHGYSVNAAAELGYDYFYKDNIYFRPLFALDYSYVTTEEFTEKNAASADLTVYSGSYNRVNTSLGFQVNNGTDLRAKWYAEAKLNFLLAGRYGEFDGEFKNTAQPLSIVGIENDIFSATIGAGVLYDISKSWSAYANINGLFSGSQNGVYGNIGINYKFTTTYFDFYER